MFHYHPDLIKAIQDDRYYRLAAGRRGYRGYRTSDRSPRPVRKLR